LLFSKYAMKQKANPATDSPLFISALKSIFPEGNRAAESSGDKPGASGKKDLKKGAA